MNRNERNALIAGYLAGYMEKEAYGTAEAKEDLKKVYGKAKEYGKKALAKGEEGLEYLLKRWDSLSEQEKQDVLTAAATTGTGALSGLALGGGKGAAIGAGIGLPTGVGISRGFTAAYGKPMSGAYEDVKGIAGREYDKLLAYLKSIGKDTAPTTAGK